jgi:HK97 family phage major capsid protein
MKRRYHAETDALIAKRQGLLNRLESINSREMSPDQLDQWDTIVAQIKDIDARLTALESAVQDDYTSEANSIYGPSRLEMLRRSNPTRGRGTPWIGSSSAVSDGDVLRSWLRIGTPAEADADRELLARSGHGAGNRLEFRALSKGAGVGAEIVPQSFYDIVNQAMKAYSPVRQLAQIISTDSGEDLRVPSVDDTSNVGAIIAEGTADTEQDVAFTEIVLKSYTYSSKIVRVSNELLADTGIDLAAYLGRILGERIGRAQAAHFLTGTGSGQPQGVITGAGTVSAGSATAIAINDLINLVNAVDRAYLADGSSNSIGWLMNPSIYAAIRKLTDSQGRPIVQEVTDRGPAGLLGYPVYFAPEMDSTLVATKKTVLFGNFGFYTIRDAGALAIARSTERYFEYRQEAFMALYRTDAKVLQAGAFKVLVH